MESNQKPRKSAELLAILCQELIAIAKREDDAAADEARHLPYWAPCPDSVSDRRAAARVLRQQVRQLEAEARLLAAAS